MSTCKTSEIHTKAFLKCQYVEIRSASREHSLFDDGADTVRPVHSHTGSSLYRYNDVDVSDINKPGMTVFLLVLIV